jgi:hypothetical protein
MSKQTKAEPETRTISIPVHPDDYDVPISLVHIPISRGRYVTLCGPLAYKTLKALQGTLEACKDALVTAPPEDFEI